MRYLGMLTCVLLLSACAGFNPNPGERNVDVAWNANNVEQAYRQAIQKAQLGEPWAQLRVGIFYENGWGVEQNIDKAEYWYKQAAVQETTSQWAEGILGV